MPLFMITGLGLMITARQCVSRPDEDPWVPFQDTYDRCKDFLNYDPVWRAWIRASLELALDDNVQYLEIRAGFGKRYTLTNSTRAGGQQKIDPTGVEDVKTYLSIVKQFVEEHPNDFVNLTAIYQIARAKSSEQIEKAMRDAKRLREQFPGFVVGFGA